MTTKHSIFSDGIYGDDLVAIESHHQKSKMMIFLCIVTTFIATKYLFSCIEWFQHIFLGLSTPKPTCPPKKKLSQISNFLYYRSKQHIFKLLNEKIKFKDNGKKQIDLIFGI
jgi:hypothetical protein